jgi:hypothetical protein
MGKKRRAGEEARSRGLGCTTLAALGFALAAAPALAQESGRPRVMPRPGTAVGDVAPTGVDDPGTRIAPAGEVRGEREAQVRQVTTGAVPGAPDEDAASETASVAIPREVRQATNALWPSLRVCRGQIAAEKRASTKSVVAGQVEVRWTLRPDGRVDDAEVVALAPTDPAVLTCVRDRVAAWQYDAAPDRAARLTRKLTFK